MCGTNKSVTMMEWAGEMFANELLFLLWNASLLCISWKSLQSCAKELYWSQQWCRVPLYILISRLVSDSAFNAWKYLAWSENTRILNVNQSSKKKCKTPSIMKVEIPLANMPSWVMSTCMTCDLATTPLRSTSASPLKFKYSDFWRMLIGFPFAGSRIFLANWNT